ncbi:hypothetical protein OYT1_ch2088 [Ferriphaselus amnicola]|uniref:Uncharacterized protein n=1 Tax=Ferriphaselus amnicola TaxID=1188319 RepID=A0A2Z6GDC8_9PROT|nr:hypothetical protein [Ferriphaselus amnicola]BBE51613.1 hypothetical protein OYT1_ch2088 [Ferriphaselus amnicola]
MTKHNYIGFDKVVHDALVSARGKNHPSARDEKIKMLEKKLDTAILSQSEIADIQKQLKELKK